MTQRINEKVYATRIEAQRVLSNKHAIGQYNWIITTKANGWYVVVKA